MDEDLKVGEAVAEDAQDVADRGASGRRDHAHPDRKERERSLPSLVEEPLGGQPLLICSNASWSAPRPHGSIVSTTI